MIEITENRSVVSTVVGGWIVAVIIICEVNEVCIEIQCRTISFPNARERIIMASKNIKLTIVVNVRKIAGLHEH